MSKYRKTDSAIWGGRVSEQQLYLHEKVACVAMDDMVLNSNNKKIALLGYSCDEGVKRNQGRIGSAEGPDAIRSQLAKMPNHLKSTIDFLDVGTVHCVDDTMEAAQAALADQVAVLLTKKVFPILLGGGHDIAYAHYTGIKKFLGKEKAVGIINFDAHFDLRNNASGNTSGTPFYQIAQDCRATDTAFDYLCLGIRKDANDKALFETAMNLGVSYIENRDFSTSNARNTDRQVIDFIRDQSHVYVTIDLDGFSSSYAPGVSAPSPMGFAPHNVLETLQLIIDSKKMISVDIAEMNPKYDRDYQTAKLAASLVHFVMHAV